VSNVFQNHKIKTYLIEIKGLVQGVGFRPFVYRLARQMHLKGWVGNRTDGVVVMLNTSDEELHTFLASLQKEAPPASIIDAIDFKITEHENFPDFSIKKSETVSGQITGISPDIAVCSDCLADMKTQVNRNDYPFINCTNCGPRFTIIKELPYDREKTTLNEFKMCADCLREYTDLNDRRFHAQPVACMHCGPEYTLATNNEDIRGIQQITDKMAMLINDKKIIAVKGLGGFFIACDAFCEVAVNELRMLKNRESKPFAVMFSTVESLKEFTYVDDTEEKSLLSWKRPIVLLEQKKMLTTSVNLGFNTIGAMLPYMPIHYLLFEKLNTPAIVMTSGNFSDEPIITDNNAAIEKFSRRIDAVLTYNREIYNRNDDSVVKIIGNKERVFRRSRGYVPFPLNLNINVDGILATGAELVNCFCIGKENQAILSQHIGDLKNTETYEFYCETIEHFKKLFRFTPSVIVSDKHPDYLSTQYARETKLPHIQVQHHHAHIASCIAEHKIDEKVIGISLDGTGYGDDCCIWGSEFFICDLETYLRFCHFEYFPMPGGDKVTEEPWRMALSYLYQIFGNDFHKFGLPFLKNIEFKTIELLCNAMDKKINCPLTSGAGRLFDAVAALINLNTHSNFHAEAPMRLESIIIKGISDTYPFSVKNTISFAETIHCIIDDIANRVSPGLISAKFHNTVAEAICNAAITAREKYHINKIVLSGGTFQNKYLLEKLELMLTDINFEVYSHIQVPTNDGGIALGQLVIAAKKRYGKSC